MKCMKQSQNLKLSLSRRIFIFILGFLDSMLFGGAVFGWPQLTYILKKEGVYSNLCGMGKDMVAGEQHNDTLKTFSSPERKVVMGIDFTNNSNCPAVELQPLGIINSTSLVEDSLSQEWPQCPEQNERFALIYTLAVLFYGVPGVAVGFLLHYAGLRITRLLGGLMIAASFWFFSLITIESPDWLIPATILLSAGGNQVRLSGMQLGDLFPDHRSTTITVLSGVYAASASLFLLLAVAQENSIPLTMVNYCIGSFAFISALLSFVMPIHHIPCQDERDIMKMKGPKNQVASAPLWNSLKSASSCLHVYWFTVMLLAINCYQQFYNVWITASTCSDDEAGFYSSLFSYSNLASVFCAPVGGMFTDYLVRKSRKGTTDQLLFLTKEIQANFIPLFLTTTLTIFLYTCLLFFDQIAIIISLILMIIVRPCIIAISTAYLRIRFPADHFNRLLGIYSTLASLFLYFQYPLFQWAQRKYYIAQGVVVTLTALSLLNPLHLVPSSLIKKYVEEREGVEKDGASLQPL